MFEKTLQDVVKGIRANKRDPSDYISTVIAEIKVELKSSDAFIKAQALRKLTYLQMLGYDMSWAAFYVIEVMTMPRFAHKRVGYLAANQCFTENTEVVLLCTNHLQKEFKSQNPFDVGLAINCLANIATADLSRDLISDLVQLLGNHKPYVRKKALLAMYKLFIKYPQGLRLTFDRIKERLEDTDSSVVSCAVNVICELADKNPKNYLAMAPQFFRLLTTSSNNWMLIKVVKLLGSLVPEEPRLARKLLEPLATIIQNTAAKSLLYECIHTMTLALPFTRKADGTESKAVPAAVRLCSEHLRKFTEDPDQNLKYLGLVGFVNLMRSHPRAVAEHRSLILACLSDDDVTIRTRALELLSGMVTKRNLEDLVLNLLQHVTRAEGSYRDELIAKIIFVCSRDKYTYLTNFRWYTGVLVDISHVEGSKHGESLALQLMDVSLRVEEVREYSVQKSVVLLVEPALLTGRSSPTMMQVLGASAWIVGEYCRPHLETLAARKGQMVWFDVIQALLAPGAARLPPRVQAVYVQNAAKVFVAMCQACSDDGELGRVLDMVPERLRTLMRSPHIEVQERASTFYHLLVAYSIIQDEEGPVFQPGAGAADDEGSQREGGDDEGSSKADGGKSKKEKDSNSVANGKAPVVLDLLGLDNNESGGTGSGISNDAAEASNGGNLAEKANGNGDSDDVGSKVLMLTEMSLAPSMMGPVGAAREAATELAALAGEILKPVNQRAQSRVPPPEDMDLEQVIDSAALSQLMAVEDNGPTDLSRLSFTAVPRSLRHEEEYRVSSYGLDDDSSMRGSSRGGEGGSSSKKKSRKASKRKHKRNRHGSNGNALDDDSGEDLPASPSNGVHKPRGSGPLVLGQEGASSSALDRYKSDPFYLNPTSSSAMGGGATSTALALIGNGSDVDGSGEGRGGKKGRKKDRRRDRERGGGGRVDRDEIVPARAAIASSEDDEGMMPSARPSRPRSNLALAAVDLTKPLGSDEELHVNKPYVMQTAETSAPAAGAGAASSHADKNGRSSSSRKKESKSSRHHKDKDKTTSSSRKSKRSSKSEQAEGAQTVDLLSLPTGTPAASQPSLLHSGSSSPVRGPAGSAMRAPPPASSALALQGAAWESDLSKILSEAAVPQQRQLTLTPGIGESGGGAREDQMMTVMSGFDGIGGGGGVEGDGKDGGAATGSGRRRRDKEGSSKARKEKSSKSSSKSSKAPKEKKSRSRRTER